MYERFLNQLARFCIYHGNAVLILSFVLTIFFGILSATLELNLSFLAILPEDPEIELFKSATEKFGGSSDLLLAVEGKTPEQSIQFANELNTRLLQLKKELKLNQRNNEVSLEAIRSIDYKMDLDFIEQYGLLFIEERYLNDLVQLINYNKNNFKELYKDLRLLPYLEKTKNVVDQLGLQRVATGANLDFEQIRQFSKLIQGSLEVMNEYLQQGKEIDTSFIRQKIFDPMGSEISEISHYFFKEGYLFSSDETVLLIYIRLNIDLVQIPFGFSLFEQIATATEEVRQKYPGLKAGYTGMMAMGYEDQSNTIQRFQWISTLSLFFIILLFFYISSLKSGPLLIGIPLLIAMIWTFGIVKMGIGYVSLTSLVFAVLLFGLGIDFAIHLLVRVSEEFQQSQEVHLSIQNAMVQSGRGIITGGLTTTFAFFAMCLAKDKSAVHLGFTTGWGIFCCLITMMTIFPVLLNVALSRTKKIPASFQNPEKQKNKVILWWVSKVMIHPKKTIVCNLVLLLWCGFYIKDFRMEYDLEKIIARGIPSVKVKKLVQEKFGYTNDYLMIISQNIEQDREITRKLQQAKMEKENRNVFMKILSISQFLPPLEDQEKRLHQLKQLYSFLETLKIDDNLQDSNPLSQEEVNRLSEILQQFHQKWSFLTKLFSTPQDLHFELQIIEKRIKELCDFVQKNQNKITLHQNLGYCQKRNSQLILQMIQKLKILTNPTTKEGSPKLITLESLPQEIKSRFMSRDQNDFLILAYPQNSSFEKENVANIRKVLTSTAPNQFAGMLFLAEKMVTSGQKDFPLMVGGILIVLFVLLLADFQSFKFLFLSLVPLFFSAIVSIGLICMSGTTISILMLFAFPLIFGIGIDDGVHILHRYREDQNLLHAVSQTGRAIFLTTVTTLVSFGALLFTNHNGLMGIGMLVGIGVTLCFFFSITLLPALLVLTESSKNVSLKSDDF